MSEMVRASTKMHETTFVDFDILPSNGFIGKIVLCELDLLFEGKKFEKLISLKMIRTSAKMLRMPFVDFDICHQMASL